VSYTSFRFATFLLVSLLVYYAVPDRWKERWVLILSLAFYCTWSYPYTILLGLSVLVFWQAGLRMESAARDERKFRILRNAVLFQLLLLFSFKFMQGSSQWGWAKWVMPLGLSYYTFKLIGYAAEVYYKRCPAEKSFVSLANYAAFFPQIVSGPIQRAGDFLAQTKSKIKADPDRLAAGLRLILFGLFKKLVVADTLGSHVDQFLGGSLRHAGTTGVFATYFIPLQIYADFSGLTDMARGTAKLFGIDSPVNFKQPFYAASIPEFWKRWHMTLTSWLTDHLFIPLNLSLRSWGSFGLYASVSANMVLIGLWHGLTWNFLAFGAFHALLLSASILTRNARARLLKKLPGLKIFRNILAPIWTFHLVTVSFVIFRVDSLAVLLKVWNNLKEAAVSCCQTVDLRYFVTTNIESGFGFNLQEFIKLSVSLILMETIHAFQNEGSRGERWFYSAPTAARWVFYIILGFFIIFFGNYDDSRFVYSFF